MLSPSSYRSAVYHLLAWAIYIVYEISIVLVLQQNIARWWEYVGYYTVNIGLFYFNAHVVLKHAVRDKKRLYLLILLIPIQLGCYILLELGMEALFTLIDPARTAATVDRVFVIRYIWRGFYFIGLSTTYWLIKDMVSNHKKLSQYKIHHLEIARDKTMLENKLIRAQNAHLQAQINPHFLFNTLNFIYNTVYDVSPKASESILLLSEVMHFALDEVGDDGKLALSKEVEHIKKYVALNLMRYEDPLYLSMQFQGTFSQYRLPPLILMTFIENMFKHGDLTAPEQPSTLSLSCRDGLLCFFVKNKKRKYLSPPGHGIGTANALARLQNFYPKEKYRLEVTEDEIYYAVTLELCLQ